MVKYMLMGTPRWVMLSQYGVEMFLTVAEVHQTYLDYLFDGFLRNPDLIESFLPLRLYGPFSIFDKKDMEIFGTLIVALTCVHSREHEKEKEKREACGAL
jgi:hypothetical protein